MENVNPQPVEQTPEGAENGTENLLEKVENFIPDLVERQTGFRIPRWFRRLVRIVLLVIFVPVLIFQIPWVQSWGAKKLTTYLSKELHTQVSVGKVTLGIFNVISLDNFYVEDLSGDTLIYAGKLKINHSGLFMLFARSFKIETLILRDAEIRISRKEGEANQNFQFILDYFAKNEKPGPPDLSRKPFRLNLRHLYFENVHFLNPDLAKGEIFDVQVLKAEGHFDTFNLTGKRLALSKFLIQPKVKITLMTEKLPAASGKPGQLVTDKTVVPMEDSAHFLLTIRDFDLEGGTFALRNLRVEPERTTPSNILNYNHLDVFNLEAHFNDFSFSDLNFHGEIEKLALQEKSGFILEHLIAKDATLTCEGMNLFDMELKTPYTRLGDTLIFKYDNYHAWETFTDDVKMDLRFENSSVAIRDIMTFAPALQENPFFKENENEMVRLDGRIRGEVNSLDGKNMTLDLGEDFHFEGNFNTRDIAVKDEQYLHLNLERLHTSMGTLRKLIPGFTPPANFNKLGNLDFKGKFDGFFVDFVADGTLKTDAGTARMFMNLKLRDGRDKARYSGDLYLDDFNLGAFSNDANLGKITFDGHVKEGVGLTLDKASAVLEANIASFVFKNYEYKNVDVNGKLSKNLFDGALKIEDENIDLDFIGSVDFTNATPVFDFKADLKKLALLPLNLTKQDLQFFGKVDMNLSGTRLSNVVGKAKLIDFQFVNNKKDTLTVDSALVSSSFLPSGEKKFTVKSNLGTADIEGRFDIEKIPEKFLSFLTKNYPRYAERLGIKQAPVLLDSARFKFEMELFELQNLMGFFDEKIKGFDHTVLSGKYDGGRNELSAEVEIPLWSYEGIQFKDVYFKSNLEGEEGSIQLGVIETKFSEDQALPPISVIGDVFRDTLEFLVIASDFFNILDKINVNGVLTLEDSAAWRMSFKPSDLVVLNQTWDINTANFVRIGEGKVETRNFELTHGVEQIVLTSIRNEGLELQLRNLPLDSLAFVQQVRNPHLAGVSNLTVKAKDVFKLQGLSAALRIENLTANGDPYGLFSLDAEAPSMQEQVTASFAIEGDSSLLVGDGTFNPPAYKNGTKPPLYFDFNVDISKYPVKILNYFVAEISNLKGSVTAENIHFFGLPSKPQWEGLVNVSNASFTLNALKTTYRVPKGTMRLTNRLLDATGSVAYDKFGNKAFVEGGITHDHMRNWGLDVKINTETNRGFLAMETTAKDNPVLYGTAVGTGYVRFTGTFKQPSLYANARTMPLTHIVIPMTGATKPTDVKFITFPDKTKQEDPKKNGTSSSSDLRGLNMEFDLDLTEDALMEVIFDKTWGDQLSGTGKGDLKVILNRNGGFYMRGKYEVVSGSYLFTLMNLFLNKPFDVERGGTITWNGDPYKANININAVYSKLNTSVYNFIQEFIPAGSPQEDLARNSTPVGLKMNLKGNLLSPDIDFDIEFPSLDSELRGYAENKLRTIRQDPNELNRQVFGLLVLGQFLPSDYTLQAGDIGINTVSEMLSNQLSIYLTEFVSELLSGTDLIQGIDLDIAYNRFSSGSLSNASFVTGSELQGTLRVSVSDKVTIRFGGNFDVGGGQVVATNSALRAHEFVIEYILSKDRRLKIRAYQNTEPDIGGGKRIKTGVGLSFRKEFDSISELIEYKKKAKK